jgi:uncharacterized Fe-S cluster-containing MiaB family protein
VTRNATETRIEIVIETEIKIKIKIKNGTETRSEIGIGIETKNDRGIVKRNQGRRHQHPITTTVVVRRCSRPSLSTFP